MAYASPPSPLSTARKNLRGLIRLRNIAIAGQVLVIWVAQRWLGLELPLVPMAAIIGLLAGWNLLSAWRLSRSAAIRPPEFFLQSLVDVLGLTGLLYFAGGATNPFAWVYLIPLVIVTTLLPRLYAWVMAVLTILCYSALMAWYVPLPGTHHMTHADVFHQHIFGMWFGFVLSALLMVHFVSGMADNLRERDRQLARAREQALKDERLIALGTLAAGAAHELGTPLGTMAILVRELMQDYPEQRAPDLYDQLGILDDQIRRCKEALSVISASSGVAQAAAGGSMQVDRFLRRLVERWQAGRTGVRLRLDLPARPEKGAVLADQTLSQALNSILNNAADASPQQVELEARWDSGRLCIRVRDRGEGLCPEVGARLGEDRVSTKENGLGLGLFLAHTAIRRLGGEVRLYARKGGGICTEVTLPLQEGRPA
jgi:two-component system sensor histidine kinase RegB